MGIVGLITEYNPFHMGHEYHIKKAKELTGSDQVAVLMSGNFVQRGYPAFMNKYSRADIALRHGADVVFEIPHPFSCLSAEYFAKAAVTLFEKMGCIDYLCFGCETDDIDKLKEIAHFLSDKESDLYKEYEICIGKYLKDGLNYPVARQKAISNYFDFADILNTPNNILAIEYLKALDELRSAIQPVCIKRTGAVYHHDSNNNFLFSSSSIRKEFSSISEDLFVFDSVYKDEYLSSYPVDISDFDSVLGYRLIYEPENSFDKYMGANKNLVNKLNGSADSYTDISSLTMSLKTKETSYTAVSRFLLSIILSIEKDQVQKYLENGIAGYIKLLGIKKDSTDILKKIKNTGSLKIIGQWSEFLCNKAAVSETDLEMIENSLKADRLYNNIIRNKYKSFVPDEYKRKLTVM